MLGPKVGIVDYGAGNFRSVWEAFSRTGVELCRITDSSAFKAVTHLVLPGVGSFGNAMRSLTALSLVGPLQEVILSDRRPFLGICVGMQVLAGVGLEGKETPGLGIVDGRVVSLGGASREGKIPLPHIGWNDVQGSPGSRFFSETGSSNEFYFLHSYCFELHDKTTLVSYAEYGQQFVAAIERGNLLGVQFHPEKSQNNGLRLLNKFLKF